MSDTEELTRQTKWLCDIQEIHQLKARYSHLCDLAVRSSDASAGEELARLFTQDATVDLGAPREIIVGRPAIAKFFGETLPSSVSWAWHAPLAPVIEIHGDRASGRWVVHAASSSKDTSEAAPRYTYGRYEDEYVRTASGWKQSKLKFFNEHQTA
ncbi:MAG TPA: nuclear transport factor 2 family protein [Steroidobacteraceae bacterium]|jgi:hypothetical protein